MNVAGKKDTCCMNTNHSQHYWSALYREHKQFVGNYEEIN